MKPFSKFLMYFLAVARTQSIRKAADELHIAGSAIDRHILLGEQQLQTPLFERLPSGMRLTPVGELLYAYARRWESDLLDLTRQIDDLKGVRTGRVDILAPEALANAFLPEIAATLRLSHPGFTLNIRIADNRQISTLLLAGAADLAFVLNLEDTKNFHIHDRVSFPLGFVSRTDIPLPTDVREIFDGAVDYPLIVPQAPLALAVAFTRVAAHHRADIKVAARANNVQMIKSLVMSGVGTGFLSRLDVMTETARGDLSFMPISRDDFPPLDLMIVRDKSRQLSAAADLVTDFIIENLRHHEYGQH